MGRKIGMGRKGKDFLLGLNGGKELKGWRRGIGVRWRMR